MKKIIITITIIILALVGAGVLAFMTKQQQPFYPDEMGPPVSENLQVTTPRQGEEWPLGSIQTIQWEGVNEHSEKVTAFLTKKTGNAFTTVGQIFPWAAGSIVWKVGQILPYPKPERCPDGGCVTPEVLPGEYYIRVIDPESGAVDMSEPFLITAESLKSSVKIIYPNGGESIKRGSGQTIRWSSAGVARGTQFRIMLVYPIKDDAYGRRQIVTLGEKVSNTGSFVWTVSSSLPVQDDYQISIQNSGTATSPNDEGDGTFSITR
ncbi:MAG: GPI anchored serine-threonine rich family protein [Patescibacteria group bacterium]